MSNLPVVAQASSTASSSGSSRGASSVTSANPSANAPGSRSSTALTSVATGSSPAEGLRSVTVQRGETLDRVIRRSLPDVPLHPDFLRQAFVKHNPQAFPSGKPHLVRAGTVLQVPSMADLRALMLAQHPQAAGLLQTPDMTEHGPNGHAATDKRRWVRFP
jgi:Tfp pilus assembly protein FimV